MPSALLPAIKKAVDEDTRPGQFLLTGSANIQSLPNVRESLAGRVANIRLRTLSEGEIQGRKPDFLDRAFKQSFRFDWRVYNRDDVLDAAFRGGFPEAMAADELRPLPLVDFTRSPNFESSLLTLF